MPDILSPDVPYTPSPPPLISIKCNTPAQALLPVHNLINVSTGCVWVPSYYPLLAMVCNAVSQESVALCTIVTQVVYNA